MNSAVDSSKEKLPLYVFFFNLVFNIFKAFQNDSTCYLSASFFPFNNVTHGM